MNFSNIWFWSYCDGVKNLELGYLISSMVFASYRKSTWQGVECIYLIQASVSCFFYQPPHLHSTPFIGRKWNFSKNSLRGKRLKNFRFVTFLFSLFFVDCFLGGGLGPKDGDFSGGLERKNIYHLNSAVWDNWRC